jgi:hypothetical protein
MIITLLCEPRSGSTNLARWFGTYKNFTVLQEPLTNPSLAHYRNNELPPTKWIYSTEHLVVKELFGAYATDILDLSDKVVLLYRENEKEQVESWVNSTVTGNWHDRWMYSEIDNQDEATSIKELKKRFKEELLSKEYFRISYEDLYLRGKLQKLLDYLEIKELKNVDFPYGFKYRKRLI